jgi:hypothetical protein
MNLRVTFSVGLRSSIVRQCWRSFVITSWVSWNRTIPYYRCIENFFLFFTEIEVHRIPFTNNIQSRRMQGFASAFRDTTVERVASAVPTVETEANTDSRRTEHKKGVHFWLVHWARCASTREFCPCLGCFSRPNTKYIFPHRTLFHFILSPCRQSCRVACLFKCVSAGLRIRIRIRNRIGSGFNRVSGSGSGFGIRIQEGKNDPQK